MSDAFSIAPGGLTGILVNILPFAGMVLAGCAGFCGFRAGDARRRFRKKRQRARTLGASGQKDDPAEGSQSDAIANQMRQLSRELAHGQTASLCPPFLIRSHAFADAVRYAGLDGHVTEHAFCELRLRLTMVFAAGGCVMGYVASVPLAVLLGLAGATVGWRLPAASLKRARCERTATLEAHLPEMLDVMALGMRSGLSFDRALRLYCAHFRTELAAELARAQDAWEAGLERREDALRALAGTYDSPLFARLVEGWVRSLRFGTPMMKGLEEEAMHARSAYKSKREERIAKAPVKMMVPTGTLILPAMLMLVLGPVLLELMNGGF